jgi:NAD(P)-dependent dehydrogenase (short-subunit alcohol dehydrogenase family)
MTDDLLNLSGRVALVTGASSGIGKAAALLLARQGAHVGLLATGEADLRAVEQEILRSGGQALVLPADVSQAGQMQQAVETLAGHWGRLDCVVANAGINGVWAPLEELDPAEWEKTISINLTGTYHAVKYASPYLKKQGGAVVITSSINGTRVFSNTGASAYSTTKAGQVAFAKMIALELAAHRVRVNVICPGAIQTNINESTDKQDLEQVRQKIIYLEGQVPLTGGQPGTSEQVAQLILFLVSDMSAHITGTEVWIDGGQSLRIG